MTFFREVHICNKCSVYTQLNMSKNVGQLFSLSVNNIYYHFLGILKLFGSNRLKKKCSIIHGALKSSSI